MKPSILIAEPHGFTPEALRILQGAADVTCTTLARNGMSEAMRQYDAIWVRLGHRITATSIPVDCKCRLISTPCTGLDHIDVEACRERGIDVVSLKGETEFLADVHATAEHTLALIFDTYRPISRAAIDVATGSWCRDAYCGRELHGKTVGIIGMGRVGKQVRKLFEAFGCNIISADRGDSLDVLLRTADIVTLHVSLNAETRHLIGAKELALMKRTAILINTSRGAVVDEKALADAVAGQVIAGCALDVLENEPDIIASPLVRLSYHNRNVTITPHIGGKTHESCAKTEVFLANKVVQCLSAVPA